MQRISDPIYELFFDQEVGEVLDYSGTIDDGVLYCTGGLLKSRMFNFSHWYVLSLLGKPLNTFRKKIIFGI